jgi:hypothetical protein
MLNHALLTLPAVYVADPFAAERVRCPWCEGEVAVEQVTAVGRETRRMLRCLPCRLRLSQETRPIPGRSA